VSLGRATTAVAVSVIMPNSASVRAVFRELAVNTVSHLPYLSLPVSLSISLPRLSGFKSLSVSVSVFARNNPT